MIYCLACQLSNGLMLRLEEGLAAAGAQQPCSALNAKCFLIFVVMFLFGCALNDSYIFSTVDGFMLPLEQGLAGAGAQHAFTYVGVRLRSKIVASPLFSSVSRCLVERWYCYWNCGYWYFHLVL